MAKSPRKHSLIPTPFELFEQGIAYGNTGRHDKAITAFDEVIRRYSGDTDPVYKKIVLQAICNAAEVLKRQGRKEEAEKRRRMIDELFGSEAAKAYDDFNGA